MALAEGEQASGSRAASELWERSSSRVRAGTEERSMASGLAGVAVVSHAPRWSAQEAAPKAKTTTCGYRPGSSGWREAAAEQPLREHFRTCRALRQGR